MATLAHRRIASFGLFEANLSTGELFKSGRPIQLERQPFLVLGLLLQHAGELVSREELRAALWPDGSIVDFDRGLNVAVKKLRDALGDSSENSRFIETLSRRGYRFIAPVHWVMSADGGVAGASKRTRNSVWMWAGAGVAVVLLAAGLLHWRAGSSDSADLASLELKPVPLTSYPGDERSPALSPHGNQVAFSWTGERRDNADIYVKFLDTANPVRLTTDPGSDDMPAWSPDGRKIAFVRTSGSTEPRGAIHVIPALGGPERTLVELAPVTCYPYGTLAWSGNGEWLVFADKPSAQDPFALHMISIETGEKRKLTSPEQGLYGDAVPALSPDGRALAFVRLKASSTGDIYVMPSNGGQPNRLTHDEAGIFGLAWTEDGRELLFSSDRAGEVRLWRVRVSGGTPQPLFGIGGSYVPRGLSQRGRSLVFAKEFSDQNIWRVGVQGPKMIQPARQLIASTRDDANPQPSPDGRRIAFTSNRSGAFEIWVADSQGMNPVQITSLGRGVNAWPTWSPDGRFIAFNSDATGKFHICVVDAQGGKSRILTPGDFADVAPSWSRDERWIYYSSNRSGALQIWKIAPTGGVPSQVTKGGGLCPSVSPDGKLIYYARGGVWRVPAEGGDETPVLDDISDAGAGHWVPANGGLYFLAHEQTHAVLKFLDFRTKHTSQIMPVEKPWDVSALAASFDGRWLLFDQIDQSGSDLMAVESFR